MLAIIIIQGHLLFKIFWELHKAGWQKRKSNERVSNGVAGGKTGLKMWIRKLHEIVTAMKPDWEGRSWEEKREQNGRGEGESHVIEHCEHVRQTYKISK